MDEYKVVGKFLLPSKVTGEMIKMVVVRDERGACTMPEDEWKRGNREFVIRQDPGKGGSYEKRKIIREEAGCH